MRLRELIESLEEIERQHDASDWRIDVGLTVVDRLNRDTFSASSTGLKIRNDRCSTNRWLVIEGGDAW